MFKVTNSSGRLLIELVALYEYENSIAFYKAVLNEVTAP
ncbi:hypothetical protein EV200_101676 [Pedobacter psychrotolerans]|uniref:Uncharacterized protein n=1 Tax=Pedobacter psychrotolerans TaxID=1843235 RepID=A0A4R2HM81_9SPHI|nr:hypothetical protein EV200_101676 [Pedobacter psychrotolerans]